MTTTGTLAGTLGLFQPFRYRGYVYDWETGFYYLQSRYYDPTTGRFISADVLLSTGHGVLGHNCYAYCGDNPVSRVDILGNSWEDVEEWLEDAADTVCAFWGKLFGAEAYTAESGISYEEQMIPDPFPITWFVGEEITTYSRSQRSKSSSIITFYAQGRIDDPILSSAGIRLNIFDFSLDISLGIDNTGITGSYTKDNEISSFALRADIMKFKVGFESKQTFFVDNYISKSSYIKADVSGLFLLLVYELVNGQGDYTMQLNQQPQLQPAH